MLTSFAQNPWNYKRVEPELAAAFAVAAKLGGRLSDENVNNVTEFPTYLPSFTFGLAHKFDEEKIKQAFMSLGSTLVSKLSLPFKSKTEPTEDDESLPDSNDNDQREDDQHEDDQREDDQREDDQHEDDVRGCSTRMINER